MSRTPSLYDIHQQAFAHYLRTGERFTNREWLTRIEQKFNPYHDERGRFTSPPGVTVSWGNLTPGSNRKPSSRPSAAHQSVSSSKVSDAILETQTSHPQNSNAFRSDFIRDATEEGGHAETYFELNKRQAGFDQLRKSAGPKPSTAVQADLDEIQRRFVADRARLDARQIEVNHESSKLLRAGFAPADVAAGAFNIAIGDAEFSDYMSAAGVLPAGAIIRRTNGIIQLGGAQAFVKKLIKDHGLTGIVSHHIPARKSFSIAGISIEPGRMPVIAMTVADHMQTASWGRWARGVEFRAHQAKLLEKGDFAGALKMDIDDLERISGRSFDDGIEQVLKFTHDHITLRKR